MLNATAQALLGEYSVACGSFFFGFSGGVIDWRN